MFLLEGMENPADKVSQNEVLKELANLAFESCLESQDLSLKSSV